MSALRSEADMVPADWHVRFTPIADIRRLGCNVGLPFAFCVNRTKYCKTLIWLKSRGNASGTIYSSTALDCWKRTALKVCHGVCRYPNRAAEQAWREQLPRGRSSLPSWRIAAQPVGDGLVLSATSIGRCASAARPARTTFLQKSRRTIRA